MKIQSQDRSLLVIHEEASLDFTPQSIPEYIQNIPRWQKCMIVGDRAPDNSLVSTPKRPEGGATPSSTHLFAFDELQSLLNRDKHQHFGFSMTSWDDLVMLDVDNLPEQFQFTDLPVKIKQCLILYPTYYELSPSSQGIHIWYRGDKTKIPKEKSKSPATLKLLNQAGTLYNERQFVTWTGHKHSMASDTIALINLEEILELVVEPKITHIHTRQGLHHNTADTPSYNEISDHLFRIPPTLIGSVYEPALRRTYDTFKLTTELTNYEHWRVICCALADGISKLNLPAHEGAMLFDDWSSEDSEYPGSQEAIAKYYANLPKADGITVDSLLALGHGLKPIWPRMKVGKGEHAVPEVIVNNVHNWQASIDFYQLQIYQNDITHKIHVEGPKPIVKAHFISGQDMPDSTVFQSCVMSFAHAYHFTSATSQVSNNAAKHWHTQKKIAFNPIKRWLDESPPHDPNGPSYFDALWDTITIPAAEMHNEPLFKTYMKKNLMGIIRAHYYEGKYSATTGVVILSGPEQTRKSSWVNNLLPQELSDYVFPSQKPIKDDPKDLQIEAGGCQILLKDEIEDFLSVNDAKLKNFLVQTHDAYRPLFGKDAIKVRRKCIMFGTTNRPDLPITSDGSRRMMIIRAEYCDTEAQDEINMASVYKELQHEFDQTPVADQPNLWMLTDAERLLTNEVNSSERCIERDSDQYLKHVVDFTIPFNLDDFLNSSGGIDRSKIKSTVQVCNMITGHGSYVAKPGVMKHTLKALCGQWTNTSNKSVDMGNRWSVEGGYARYRTAAGKVSISGWLLPQPKPPTQEDME